MSPFTKTLLALASLLAIPLTVSAALCPSFTLTAHAPGKEWNGQKIIQSGRSTYLSTAAPTAPDAIATFFRNDTTHLYATNFNISYMSEHETPPFILLTLAEGFPLFDNNPDVNIGPSSGSWTAEHFNVTEDGYVGFVPGGDGIAGGDCECVIFSFPLVHDLGIIL